MNPSTDDIVRAVNETPSQTVFVLPNNKNIYMAAKQAEELVQDKKVIVLRTVSVPQGISAMLAFDPDADEKKNVSEMKQAMQRVRTEKMTFAARDSVYEDSEIKAGQILGLVENEVKYVTDTQEDCMKALCADLADYSCITLFYGQDVSAEDAEKMTEFVRNQLDEDKEVMLLYGGQPVYYYIVSAE